MECGGWLTQAFGLGWYKSGLQPECTQSRMFRDGTIRLCMDIDMNFDFHPFWMAVQERVNSRRRVAG
jgi:ribosomal protein L31